MQIYDISQPSNPTLVTTISSVANIGRVAAANGRLYALRSYGPPLQLHIFDLSAPITPRWFTATAPSALQAWQR